MMAQERLGRGAPSVAYRTNRPEIPFFGKIVIQKAI
jgi:hypothetical protein